MKWNRLFFLLCFITIYVCVREIFFLNSRMEHRSVTSIVNWTQYVFVVDQVFYWLYFTALVFIIQQELNYVFSTIFFSFIMRLRVVSDICRTGTVNRRKHWLWLLRSKFHSIACRIELIIDRICRFIFQMYCWVMNMISMLSKFGVISKLK